MNKFVRAFLQNCLFSIIFLPVGAIFIFLWTWPAMFFGAKLWCEIYVCVFGFFSWVILGTLGQMKK